MYRQATARLADLRYRAGRTRDAIVLYREMLEAEPTLELVVRNLLRCYHRLRDREALVREEQRLRKALKEALYDPDQRDPDPGLCQPERETTALYGRLLQDLDSRVTSAAT
jgi:hypothetical protein